LSFFVEKLDAYAGRTEYEQAKRVFQEHFCFEENQLIIKKGKDMGGNTLQSPDDPEATYRQKNGENARGCPFAAQCPAKPLKKKALWIVRFSDNEVRIAMQRQKLKENKDAVNIRASVENTIRCVIHPFGGHLCKLPVRGKKRIKTMIFLSVMMVNIRRITKYMLEKLKNTTLQPVWV
jgi:hypothetical protein